ncbi:MAG: hypothetical protein LUD68_00850, partial [Rikenellaceae bacterium]|nr:hypothetical protein [Rikenellaceae bacterium]
MSRANNFRQTTNDITQRQNDPKLVTHIQFRSGGRLVGRIRFTYEGDKYLQEMTVTNALDQVVKTIRFTVGKSGNGKLAFLHNMTCSDSGKYVFEYYNASSHTVSCGELDKNSDWWGYYSSRDGWFKEKENLELSYYVGSNSTTQLRDIAGGSKNADEYSSKVGMLTSIVYPAGGKTTFEYEGHKGTSNKGYGGLRIKQVTNIPDLSLPNIKEVKSYTYGTGSLPPYLNPPTTGYENMYIENMVDCYINIGATGGQPLLEREADGRYIKKNFLHTFPAQYSEFHGSAVRYASVTETIINSEGDLQTQYEYDLYSPS